MRQHSFWTLTLESSRKHSADLSLMLRISPCSRAQRELQLDQPFTPLQLSWRIRGPTVSTHFTRCNPKSLCGICAILQVLGRPPQPSRTVIKSPSPARPQIHRASSAKDLAPEETPPHCIRGTYSRLAGLLPLTPHLASHTHGVSTGSPGLIAVLVSQYSSGR